MNEFTGPEKSVPPKRAVIYARMSTEHQKYSTENQSDAIREYAARQGMEIIRSYIDDGKSGLKLDGRDSLKQLFATVQSGRADFETILVYDISRWGRFQDTDESAYYEYICRRAGIAVVYCAEQFQNDGSPSSTIIKSVKRAMAGEYSRELSSKVFQGQCRLIQLGYRQGGHAGYGLRRMLIDQQGNPKGELSLGEMKSIQTDRVILVPGPDDEVAVLRWIFTEFVENQKSESEIAESLNARGLQTDLGRAWNKGTVRQVLTNEKYIGNNVYNRMSFKLKKQRIRNPEEMWIRADGAFEAIVDVGLFWAAREIIVQRARKYSDNDLIHALKGLYQKTGWLSSVIIDECDSLPSSAVYRHRFGNLLRAYQLVGYEPDRDFGYLEVNRRLREMHPHVVQDVIARMTALGGSVMQDADLYVVNAEFTVSLIIARCHRTTAGAYRWNIRLDRLLRPDITVAVRMDGSNNAALDYYLLPSMDMSVPKLRLSEQNGVYFDTYRFDTLDHLYSMAQRTRVEVA